MKTIYTVGAISSDPKWKEKFQEAKEKYESLGYKVLSPLDHGDGLSYADYMRLGVEYVFMSDKLLTISGWKDSPGALAEVALAECLLIEIIEFQPLKWKCECGLKNFPAWKTCKWCGSYRPGTEFEQSIMDFLTGHKDPVENGASIEQNCCCDNVKCKSECPKINEKDVIWPKFMGQPHYNTQNDPIIKDHVY